MNHTIKYLALNFGGTPMVTTADMPTVPTHILSPAADSNLKFINGALTLLITAGTIAALIAIIWGGAQWTRSGGDKQKVAAAKGRLTWGIIGLVIIFLSFFIVNVFAHLFGIELLIFVL